MIGAIGSPLTPTERIEVGFQQISSGKKSPSFTSPAVLAIGQKLLNNASFASARNSNVVNEISMSQTRSAFVQSSHDTVGRLSELSVKANSGMLSAQDREAIQIEANELTKHLRSNMENASFNGNKLLDDSDFSDMVSSFEEIDLTTQAGIENAGDVAKDAIDMLSQKQATLGAEQGILEQQFRANLEEEANLLDAGSRMTDADIAQVFSQLSSDTILSNVSTAMSAQAANLESSTVSALLS
ncbi:MAG: hypothetical protein NE334_05015 [Lentisphaeraceae bacterium]|nr:hypothetical protein [Lentisphaeraceae bacterium]